MTGDPLARGLNAARGARRVYPTTAHTHAHPTKIFSIFQSLWKTPKTSQVIDNTQNIGNIV